MCVRDYARKLGGVHAASADYYYPTAYRILVWITMLV